MPDVCDAQIAQIDSSKFLEAMKYQKTMKKKKIEFKLNKQ